MYKLMASAFIEMILMAFYTWYNSSREGYSSIWYILIMGGPLYVLSFFLAFSFYKYSLRFLEKYNPILKKLGFQFLLFIAEIGLATLIYAIIDGNEISFENFYYLLKDNEYTFPILIITMFITYQVIHSINFNKNPKTL